MFRQSQIVISFSNTQAGRNTHERVQPPGHEQFRLSDTGPGRKPAEEEEPLAALAEEWSRPWRRLVG